MPPAERRFLSVNFSHPEQLAVPEILSVPQGKPTLLLQCFYLYAGKPA
jgi:hypothetical protein